MGLKKKADDTLKKMYSIIDSADIKNIKTDGITIRNGDRILQLKVVKEKPLDGVEEIKAEIEKKVEERLTTVRTKLNNKITEMVEFTSQVRDEAEKKEKTLKNKLAKATPMPDVDWKYAKKGLSVVRGQTADSYKWMVHGVYYPKFVDKMPIEPSYAKKWLTAIMFVIETKGDKVIKVSTHKLLGLDFFPHYHQNRPDCWGQWSFPKTWKTPDDILKIARDAEAVLETINTGSIANRSPENLPRKNTLDRHLVKDRTVDINKIKKTSDIRRMGDINTTRSTETVWRT